MDRVDSTEKLDEEDMEGVGCTMALQRTPFQGVPMLQCKRVVEKLVQPPRIVRVGHHVDDLFSPSPRELTTTPAPI